MFNRQWRDTVDLPNWDYLCEQIHRALLEIVNPEQHPAVLEMGSGTGRISVALAACGAEVCMLDASEAALALAREQLGVRSTSADLVLGDMASLPFGNEVFDVVWSAGVLEHYSDAEIVNALSEMKRVVRGSGVVVTMVPFALSIPYRLAHYFGMRFGTWPGPPERWFRTFQGLNAAAGLVTIREWAIAPEESKAFYLAHVKTPGRRLLLPLFHLFRRLGLTHYLLVSVARRQSN